jgi:hypothetical protein
MPLVNVPKGAEAVVREEVAKKMRPDRLLY